MADDMTAILPCGLCGMPFDGAEAQRINEPLGRLRAEVLALTTKLSAKDSEILSLKQEIQDLKEYL